MDAIRAEMEEAMKTLKRDGYCVIPGVLSPERCRELENRLWAKIELISNGSIKRSDPSTHRGAKWFSAMKGIIQEPSELNHLDVIWEVRKAAVPYFAHMWGSPFLMSSFDRFNMYPAPKEGQRMIQPKGWMHTDQSPLKKDLYSVQGFVDLCGTGDLDSGLVVAKGSHLKHHQLLYKKWNLQEIDDWHMFSEEQRKYIDEHFEVVKIKCPQGSLVLWDSRTFHQNEPPKMGGHQRLVVYTCMLPHYAVPASQLPKVLEKKAKAFDEMRTTTHSPVKSKLFPKFARTYGKEKRTYSTSPAIIQQPKDDPVIRSLVGQTPSVPAIPWNNWNMDWFAFLDLVPAELQVANKKQLLERIATTQSRKTKATTSPEERPRKRQRVEKS